GRRSRRRRGGGRGRHRGRWGFLCVRNGRYPERNPGGAAGQQSGDDTNSNAFVHAEILPIPEDESAASSPQSVGTASDIPGNGHSFRAIGAAFAVRWTVAAVVAPQADGWRVQPGWLEGASRAVMGSRRRPGHRDLSRRLLMRRATMAAMMAAGISSTMSRQ